MSAFSLKIVTPDGLRYEGEAEALSVRTTTGDLGILAGHVDYVAPLGMGRAMIQTQGQKRYGACIGGMVSVVKGEVRLVATSFEWADQIDTQRAKRSAQRAKETLARKDASSVELRLAEARLKRALVRQSVANQP